MLLRWLRGASARPAEIADMQARIPDLLWADVLRTHPFLDLPDPGEAAQLRARAAWVLASKTMNEAGGLVLTDTIRLVIAAQAALPVLNLSASVYEGWNEIIVYPGGFSVMRRHQDDNGVVHEYVEEAAGEVWEGGPVVLSWAAPEPDDADGTDPPPLRTHAYNVVIHEFAHKLDLEAGSDADGMPALHRHPDIAPARWRSVLEDSLDRFATALERIEDSIPAYIDPESPDANPWYARLPMDPYAATDEAEFFAVSSETFFTDPEPLARDLPEWYGLLAAYYRQNPLARRANIIPPPPP